MKFEVNGITWSIVKVEDDAKELIVKKSHRLGTCNYVTNTISIMGSLPMGRFRNVLTHEVAHAFLADMGMFAFWQFDHEQLCEFVACHSRDIVDIVNNYMEFFFANSVE